MNSTAGGTHLALARKWRPMRFAEVAGQEHAVQALKASVAAGRAHHAFMFTGTRGVGKTTLARILAKSFNCAALGEDGEPCCECESCRQVAGGAHPDVIEIDAASNTQVENMRELLDSASYAPAMGRCKVYIIDEVHMLSRHSFNAMLKTLEEPPEHVKFVLATTDPQQVPATVQSRCLRFALRRLPRELIAQHLERVLAAEGIEYEKGAVAVIAAEADGSVRDALSVLDEAIASGDALREDATRELVGVAGVDQAPRILAKLLDGDVAGALELAEQLHRDALSLERVAAALVELVHQAQLAKLAPALAVDLPAPLAPVAEIDPLRAQVLYEIATQARTRLAESTDQLVDFEMLLLRMAALLKPAPAKAAAGGPAAESPAREAPAPEQAPASKAQPGAAMQLATMQDWNDLTEALDTRTATLAQECAFVARDGLTVRLALDPKHKHLTSFASALEKAVREKLGEDVELAIEMGRTDDRPVPRQVQEQKEATLKEKVLSDLETSAQVSQLREKFPGARLREDTLELEPRSKEG